MTVLAERTNNKKTRSDRSEDKGSSFRLDRDSGLPFYLQIAHQMMYQLETGLIRLGDKLPSTRALARELTVSFLTVDKAYRWLRSRGVVASQRGVGWQVLVSLDPTSEEGRQRLRTAKFVDEILESAVARGFEPITVAQAVLQRAMALERQIPARKMAFIECHADYVDDYTSELRKELADLNIDVTGLLTTQLGGKQKGRDRIFRMLKDVDYVLTTLYHYEFVQKICAPLKRRVVALSHTIDKDALYSIASLPQETRIGALFGRLDPAPAIVRTLEFYRDLPLGSIPFALVTDAQAMKRVLNKADVLVYTAACRKRIRLPVGDTSSAILVRFVPDDDAVKKIRTLFRIPFSPGPLPVDLKSHGSSIMANASERKR
jgi:DNA-binding transcriptional regulator YhcF (GntR family)